MKLFGHPVHIMLIHFPTALLPMDFFCSAISVYRGDPLFAMVAYIALTGGVVLGWISIFFGATDLVRISSDRPSVLTQALRHGIVNLVVIIGFTVLLLLKYRQYPNITSDGTWIFVVKFVLLSLMIAGNYLGGQLILKYRVGVENE